MVLEDRVALLLGLQLERRLDHGGDQPRVDVPLDVAVEEPDARVVAAEAQHDVAVGAHPEGIAAHGYRREGGVGRIVVAAVLLAASDGLEVVAMEVEGMFAWVVVVQDDLNDLVVGEYKGICVDAIDGWVGGVIAGGDGGIEGGKPRTDVGDAVEEGIVGAIDEIVHFHFKIDAMGWVHKERLIVVGNKGEVIERLEGIDSGWGWKRSGGIVDEEACCVRIERGRHGVEEILSKRQ